MNEPDKRTVVDRVLERLKNNRVAAAVIVLGIGLTALASFTDSLKKLSAMLPGPPKIEVNGEWISEPVDLFGAGPQIAKFQFKELAGDRLTGSVRFYGPQGRPATPDFGVLDGKRDGNKLTFSFESGIRRTLDSGTTYVPVPDRVYGEISKNAIKFVDERDGYPAVQFLARKASTARGNGA